MVASGFASRALAGSVVSGDLRVVTHFDGGVVLAAIDGLGHGPDAAVAAEAAAGSITRFAAEPVCDVMRQCHLALKSTRGAAVSLASICDATGAMTWIGVGNVEAVSVSAATGLREHLFLRGGILGHNLPQLRPGSLQLSPGDTLIFATDGIRPGFHAGGDLGAPPEALARAILDRSARPEDDALVLVARWTR